MSVSGDKVRPPGIAGEDGGPYNGEVRPDVPDPPFVFDLDQASRLVGVTSDLISKWHRDGVIRPRFHAEEGTYRLLFTFRDLVGLRTLRTLREMGVSMQYLKKVAAKLRREHATPWSSLRFWLGSKRRRRVGRCVYFSGPDGQPIGVDDDQVGIPIALEEIAAQVRIAAEKARERDPATVGKLTTGAVTAVAGTGVPVKAIQQFASAGYSVPAILKEYPALTEKDVRAALQTRRSA